MKFQCDSCGAKYKIADEKVAGRNNVRFSCRRCSHKILLGDPSLSAAPSATAQGNTPARRSDKSEDDFMTAKRPGVQPLVEARSATDAPIWHVSINDVPIGPIKREELAHKIDSGAVSEYSLVWNSSFEEWRPLATVPELMSLIHNRRGSRPPTTSRFSSTPPEPRTRVAQVSEVLRASAVSQPTMAAAPGLSDPFGQVVVAPQVQAKPGRRAELLNDPFGGNTVNTLLEDAFDQPTVSSLLDEQPTVNSLLDEALDQGTVSSELGEELTMSALLGEEVTVNSMLDDQPTVNSLLDEENFATSLVGDPSAPTHGVTSAHQARNAPPQGIPLPSHDGSGSFSMVLTASSFTPEAPDSTVAEQPFPASEPVRQSRPVQDRRSALSTQPVRQKPRGSSVGVAGQDAYPSVPPAPQPVATPRAGMSPWAWVMVASFAVFAGVFAVLVFDKLVNEGQLGPFSFGRDDAKEVELPAETEITETEIVQTENSDSAFAVDPLASEPAEPFDPTEESGGLVPNSVQLSADETDMTFELDEEGMDEDEAADGESDEQKPQSQAKPRSRTKSRTRAATSKAALSTRDSGAASEDAKLLAQFEESGAARAAKIDVTKPEDSQAQRQPLGSKDLAAVVNKNKPRLQRCYERAIRGQQEPPSVRLDVALNIAVSGRVSSATATGRGPGGLTECVESLVQRWRFPVSSEPVETHFPVVFAAN